MGMLAEAKKKAQKSESDKEHLKPDPKHKKKHAKPSPEVASNKPGVTPGATEPDSSGPDAEPESDAVGADASGESDQGAPDAGADESAPDADGQGAAPSSQPQDPQDQGAQGADTGADQGGPPSGAAEQDQSQDEGGTGQGASPQEGAPDDSAGGGAGQPQDNVDLSKIPVSPALKEEFMRCNAALHTALYTNDQVAQHVINGIVPQGPHKVESVARMATLLVVQINKQLHFIQSTPQIVMPFTQDVVEHVLDLVSQVKGIQFSEQEAHAALGTAQEIIMHTCGVTKKQMQAVGHVVPRSQIMDGLEKYKAHLQNIKGVQGPNSPDQGTPTAGGGSPGAPAGQPASPGGAPAGGPSPAGQPQPGAPVTAAPGPGQSAPPGGMLTAAQAPGGQ